MGCVESSKTTTAIDFDDFWWLSDYVIFRVSCLSKTTPFCSTEKFSSSLEVSVITQQTSRLRNKFSRVTDSL